MLHTEFQASEPSDSEEEDFLILSTYFYDSNLGLSGAGVFGPQSHHLEEIW